MRNTLQESNNGVRRKITTKLEDLDFAGDIALKPSRKQYIQIKNDKLTHEAEKVGLKVDVGKCNLLRKQFSKK